MRLTRFSPLAAFAALLLAGCGSGPYTVTYGLSFNVTDQTQVSNLSDAASRVVQRRLDNMGVLQPGIESASGTLAVTVPDKAGADELTRQLTSPFTMQVMVQTASGATPDLSVEGHGGFSKTNVTTEDFVGAEAGKDASGKVRARILMTDAGSAKMNELFKAQQGRNIGIFVRDRLISQLKVASDSLTDDLQIQNIPNLLVAEAFMDDVNVGLHVVYTPKP